MKCLYLVVLSSLFAACSSGWSDEEKKAYLDACNGVKGVEEYCDCTLEKVMIEAPDPKDADKVDINKVAASCLDKIKY